MIPAPVKATPIQTPKAKAIPTAKKKKPQVKLKKKLKRKKLKRKKPKRKKPKRMKRKEKVRKESKVYIKKLFYN